MFTFVQVLAILLHQKCSYEQIPICTTSMHFSLSPTQESGSSCPISPRVHEEIHVCSTSLLVDEYYGWCLRNENLPVVGRGAVATAFYCSHHGWVEAVGHAELEVVGLRNLNVYISSLGKTVVWKITKFYENIWISIMNFDLNSKPPCQSILGQTQVCRCCPETYLSIENDHQISSFTT